MNMVVATIAAGTSIGETQRCCRTPRAPNSKGFPLRRQFAWEPIGSTRNHSAGQCRIRRAGGREDRQSSKMPISHAGQRSPPEMIQHVPGSICGSPWATAMSRTCSPTRARYQLRDGALLGGKFGVAFARVLRRSRESRWHLAEPAGTLPPPRGARALRGSHLSLQRCARKVW